MWIKTVLYLALCLPSIGWAKVVNLDAVKFNALPGNKVQVKLELSGPLSREPLSFTIDDPARIALDLPDTRLNLPSKNQPIGVGTVRSLNAVEAGGRTRVVLNLSRLVPYDLAMEGNTAVVTLGSEASSTSGGIMPAITGRAHAMRDGASIEDVDFRRGNNGEGRIIVALSDPDLAAIYTLAEQHDPQFQQVEASRRAILAVKPQARAQLMLPSVTISANVTRNFQNISIGDTQGGVIGVIPATDLQGVGGGGYTEFTSGDYTLSITQPVYHYDRTLQYRQADTRIQQANAEFGAARQDLIIRVAERYFDVLAAMDTLEFAGAEKQALFQQLDQAKQRFEVGLVAITDVQEAQAGYDRAVADWIQAESLLENAREALRELTNEYHQTLLKLGEEIPLIAPVPPDIDRWIAKSLEQNLRLAAAFQATKVARQEIARQSAGHRPTLDLIASHSSSTTGGRFRQADIQADIDSSAIGLQFNLPIYQGGQVNSRTREAQHRHEEALARLEQERRAAHRQAHDAYLGVIAGISRVKALRQAVISNQISIEATQAGFEVGTRTGVDVVNAQREVFRAKRDYAQSRYNYILDTLRLKRAAGMLTPADLTPINTWLSR